MFDFQQEPNDDDGSWDEELVADYCDGLCEAYAESPEGVSCASENGRLGWARSFLDFGCNYLEKLPSKMSRHDVAEILFDLFPRKVSVDAEAAQEIVGEIRSFWEFLSREYHLANAAEILQELGTDAEEELHDLLSDSDNFDMAKSFFMLGKERGFDMTTQAGLDAFRVAYNQAIIDKRSDTRENPPAYAVPRPSSAAPRPKVTTIRLTAEERKAREKLRRAKLGKPKRRSR